MRYRMFAPALWATTVVFLAACGGGGGGGSSNPPANRAPTATAGPNQTVTACGTITLNGTGADSDGTVTGYTWTQTGGTPTVTLSSSTVAQPTFAAPSVATTATLTFSLVVRDNRGASSNASSVSVSLNPPIAGTLCGRVRFTRIAVFGGPPITTGSGLNFGGQVLQPARGVLVHVVAAGNPQTVLATTTTNSSGEYSATVAPDTSVNVIVVAQMLRESGQPLPRWNFSAEDAEAATPTPYTYTDGASFNSNVGTDRNLDIPSGINTAGTVTGTRASAPFAVLDTVYQAVQLILSVAPTTDFPELILDWATDNPGGVTYFDSGLTPQAIVLSAEVSEDTDEFDQHVIAHEFGHYIEANYSRADNIGGLHSLGDKLDIRTAFGEGFGYAFSAMALNDPVAVDTFVQSGAQVSSTFDIEVNPPPTEPVFGDFGCWCSESSVWSILWDLYDNTADANDGVALGFQPLWNVLTGTQRTTPAFTSLFSFVSALKTANPNSAVAIDTLVTAQNVSPIADAWATGETHVPNPVAAAAALPLYTSYGAIGGPAIMVRNVNDAGTYNTLGNRRFIRFDVANTRSVTVTASSSNPNPDADTDFLVWRAGEIVAVGFDYPSVAEPQETETFTATAGTYLIDVYDCANGCSPPAEGVAGDYNLTVSVN